MADTLSRGLTLNLILTCLLLGFELLGGKISGSLALLSDAGHVGGDLLAIVMVLVARKIGELPSSRHATFGYKRVPLLAGLINGLILISISLSIYLESYKRFLSPKEINSTQMLIFSSFGLLFNLLMLSVLKGRERDLSIRSVWLHVVSDTLSSVGVVLSSIVITFTGFLRIDPITSAGIASLIFLNGARLILQVLSIFLNLTPKGYDLDLIAEELRNIDGVMGIHDLHLWPISERDVAFSAHVLLRDQNLSETDNLKKRIEALLRSKGINHVTLQFECCDGEGEKEIYCQI